MKKTNRGMIEWIKQIDETIEEVKHLKRSIKILNREVGVHISEMREQFDGTEVNCLSDRLLGVERKLDALEKHLNIMFKYIGYKTIPAYYKIVINKKEKTTTKK